MKNFILQLFILTAAVPAFAEDSLIVQKSTANNSFNVFISGHQAESIHRLLAIGVPPDSLPQGHFLEGGNIGCAKMMMGTTSSTFCAYNQDAKGITTAKTPTFNASQSTTGGAIELVEAKATGTLVATVSGKAAEELYSLFAVPPDSRGRKIAKNQLCTKAQERANCVFIINQRGFTDFPETKLAD